MKYLIFALLPITAFAQAPTWSNPSHVGFWPAGNGYLQIRNDPVSNQIILYHSHTSVPIYSSDISFLQPGVAGVNCGNGAGNPCWTNLGTSGQAGTDACIVDTATWPGDRHPDGAFAVDTRRGRLYMYGGPNQSCAGSVSVTNGSPNISATSWGGPWLTGWNGHGVVIGGVNYTIQTVTGTTTATLTTNYTGATAGAVSMALSDPDGHPKRDLWHLTLNKNPIADTWTRDSALIPFGVSNQALFADCDYDPIDDVVFCYGYDGGAGSANNWLICPTSGGVLSSTQIAVGCVQPDNLNLICPGGTISGAWPTQSCSGITMGTNEPGGAEFPNVRWSPIIKKFVFFGGATTVGTGLNELWTIDIHSSWVKQTPSGTPPGIINDINWTTHTWYQVAYDTTRNLMWVHQSSGTGAPQDLVYDPVANSWTTKQTGQGNAIGSTMTYNPGRDMLVTWSEDTSSTLWTAPISGTPSLVIPLTTQEALVPGTTTAQSTGVNRSNEPTCAGLPIALSQALTSTASLGMTNTSAAQFRSLATWDGTHIKWLKACWITQGITAGGTDITVSLTNGGSGNFGGSNLAVDSNPGNPNVGTITITTGTATFTVKKANFNIIDTAVLGSTTLLATSAVQTRGLVILGPVPTGTFPANVTCGTCNTIYSSANDSSSTAVIEENGPVMTVIKANGTFYDNASHPYMHWTVRLTFYLNRNSVKVTVIRRNADYSTTATPSADCNFVAGACTGLTFNTAAKGYKSYELRLNLNLSGTLTYLIATDTGTTSNSLSGTDSAYIYQGQSHWMESDGSAQPGFCAIGMTCANLWTTDQGFNIVKNAVSQMSGTAFQYPTGWADIFDSSNNGLIIGHYQMAAYWPKSLEFDTGGSDVRLGLGPSENGNVTGGPGNGTFNQYAAWTGWEIRDMFLEFHVGSNPLAANDFIAFQHPLIARPSPTYTNNTSVFPYPIVDPTVEDAFYLNTQSNANPAVPLSDFCFGGSLVNGVCVERPDRSVGTFNGVSVHDQSMGIYAQRYISWTGSGPLNQTEFRWSDLLKFEQRGYVGGWNNSLQWYKYMQAEAAWPHSDGTNINGTDATINGFSWQSRPHVNASQPELDTQGLPLVAQQGASGLCTVGTAKMANYSLAFLNYMVGCNGDYLHYHWDGMLDFYNLTGDETIKDAMLSLKSFYLNADTFQQAGPSGINGGYQIQRAIGIFLRTASRFGDFLSSIGDSDAASVTASAVTMYTNNVQPDPCTTEGGSNWPAGCTMPSTTVSANNDPRGVSRVRGHSYGSRVGGGWCPDVWGTNGWRIDQPFEAAIEIEGILQLARSKGSSWTFYNEANDLAFGLAQAQIIEGFNTDGTSNWSGASTLFNGFRYLIVLDRANGCASGTPFGSGTFTTADGTHITIAGITANANWAVPFIDATHGSEFDGGFNVTTFTDGSHIIITPSIGVVSTPAAFSINPPVSQIGATLYDSYTMAAANQTLWPIFFALHSTKNSFSDWQTNLAISLVRMTHGRSVWPADFGDYQMGSLIYFINLGLTTILQDVTITNVTNIGGNQQNVSYTIPAGSSSPRLKYDTTRSVQFDLTKLLQLDNITTNAFTTNPATNINWFAATDSTASVLPWTSGAQTVTVTTGSNSLTAANFSLKALFPVGCSISPTSLGPWTVGQIINTTLVASNCAASSWACTGLPTGLNINSGTGLISGTILGSGTFNANCTFATASQPYTIVVNTAATSSTTSISGAVSGGALISR